MPGPFLHELVGSMSQGAAGNPTVVMVEAAFRHHGLHWRYVNMEVAPADLADAVRGARAMGLGMIVNQGVISIEHWTGISPDPVVMRRAVEQALGLSRVGEKDEG
jgi:shikimate dehydrogenase